MNSLRWIKLRTDLFSDPDLRLLLMRPDGRDCVLVWQLLLTLAGRSNDHGRIWRREGLPYTPAHLAAMLYADEHLIESSLAALEEAGLVEEEDGVLVIPDWDDEQVAGVEEELNRTATRERVRRYRQRTAASEDTLSSAPAASDPNEQDPEAGAVCETQTADCPEDLNPGIAVSEAGNAGSCSLEPESEPWNGSSVTCNGQSVTCNAASVTCNADVTPIEREIERETEKKRERESRARFVPPTVKEVAAYCRQRGNRIDPERFVDYYTANGWLVGKNRMKDWRAAVRNWENNGLARGSPGRAVGPGKRFLPPGAVLSPNGIPILPDGENDLEGIL